MWCMYWTALRMVVTWILTSSSEYTLLSEPSRFISSPPDASSVTRYSFRVRVRVRVRVRAGIRVRVRVGIEG